MGHTEQHERTKRWYERFKSSSVDTHEHNLPSTDYYQDDLYAFFINCYHIKDWIKNDPKVAKSVKDLTEPYINSNPDLRVCADLCNGSKHFRLTNKRTATGANIGPRNFSLSLGQGLPKIKIKYNIICDGKVQDAHKLAEDCMKAWKIFYHKHNLN